MTCNDDLHIASRGDQRCHVENRLRNCACCVGKVLRWGNALVSLFSMRAQALYLAPCLQWSLYGADYLSGQRSEQFALYLDFERALPSHMPDPYRFVPVR